jgi:hypothetical protein
MLNSMQIGVQNDSGLCGIARMSKGKLEHELRGAQLRHSFASAARRKRDEAWLVE